MKALLRLVAFCVLASLATTGCNRPRDKVADAQAKGGPSMPSTDIEGLERFINLPYRPADVKWSTSTQPGRDDWSLRALLHFSADDVQRILTAAGGAGTRKAYMSPDQLSWMPNAVRAEANRPVDSTGLIPVNAVPIGVEQFAAPNKSPLIHGTALVFVTHNLVYLGLYTM